MLPGLGRVDAGVVVGYSSVAKIVPGWELFVLSGKEKVHAQNDPKNRANVN